MKYFTYIGILLILLTGCVEKQVDKTGTEDEVVDESTKVEKDSDTKNSDGDLKEEQESAITEKEAKAISLELVTSFNKLMWELGEQHQWNFENPGVYEVAKPDLLAVATERFADDTLKSYVEEYYCSCDSGWHPKMDELTIRMQISDLTENSFIVNGINLPDYVSSGDELTMKFIHEEDGWKIDHWAHTSVIGKKLNLTEEEISEAYPGGEVLGEYQTQDGITAYKVKLTNEMIGISKDNGELYFIE